MTGNMSYKCFIYFDKYILAAINNVNDISLTNSLTLFALSTNGTSNIVKYYISIDDGKNFFESSSSTYTFNNLIANTKYNISVKLIDSLGKESLIYMTSANTLNIISFTIGGVSYNADVNMIWAEWVK